MVTMTAKKACSVDSCEAVSYCKGLCRNHHSAWYRRSKKAGVAGLTVEDQRMLLQGEIARLEAERAKLVAQLAAMPTAPEMCKVKGCVFEADGNHLCRVHVTLEKWKGSEFEILDYMVTAE